MNINLSKIFIKSSIVLLFEGSLAIMSQLIFVEWRRLAFESENKKVWHLIQRTAAI
jgi:hypothetical protein